MNATARMMLLLALSPCSLACGDDGDDDDDTSEEQHETDAGHHAGDGGSGEHPDCAAITAACHDPDTGEAGDIHTCHSEIAHHNDPVQCAAEKERCIALCEAASGDAGHD
jgi:hypothetical protein